MTREQMLISELNKLKSESNSDDKTKQRIWEIQTELNIIAEYRARG